MARQSHSTDVMPTRHMCVNIHAIAAGELDIDTLGLDESQAEAIKAGLAFQDGRNDAIVEDGTFRRDIEDQEILDALESRDGTWHEGSDRLWNDRMNGGVAADGTSGKMWRVTSHQTQQIISGEHAGAANGKSAGNLQGDIGSKGRGYFRKLPSYQGPEEGAQPSDDLGLGK